MIEVHCAVTCVDDGLLTQSSSCAMLFEHVDEYNRHQHRKMSFRLGNSSKILAWVSCAHLALSSIINQFRKQNIVLYITDVESYNLINDGIVIPKYSKQMLNLLEMRKLYPNLRFINKSNNQIMKELETLSNSTLNGKEYDSLTINSHRDS